jgi:hypothetical protein
MRAGEAIARQLKDGAVERGGRQCARIFDRKFFVRSLFGWLKNSTACSAR